MKSSESISKSREVATEGYLNRILINNSEKKIFVDIYDINWIESSGNYLKLHLENTTHLVRGTMKKMEKKLNPLRFMRIHRSFIVNVGMIKSISRSLSGDYKVRLENGRELKMSRNYKEALDRFQLN